MKIKQIAGLRLLSDDTRRDIEGVQFSNVYLAGRYLQRRFPLHVVQPQGERIDVRNRDGSFVLLSFKRH